MRFPVKRLLVMFFILALAVANGRPAVAEEATRAAIELTNDEIERWVPALSASLGMMMQRAELEFESSDLQLPFFLDPGNQRVVRAPGSGRDLLFAPMARASVELMTPGLLHVPFLPAIAVPGRPRLFVHADAAASFAQKYDLAKNGKIDKMTLPDRRNNQPVEDASNITGQGSRGQAKIDTLVWSAGAGVALSFDIFERRVRIKPSFEWMREKVSVNGATHRAVKKIRITLVREDFRFIVLDASKSKVFNGIGAGLEIELESRRTGPFVLSTFMGARVHRFMGNLDIDLEDTKTNEYGNDEWSEFHYTHKRWSYQGFVGIRMRFVPE